MNTVYRKMTLYIGIVTLVLLLVAPTTAASASAPFILRADAVWADSGIVLAAGDTVTITARGQVLTGPLRDFPDARSGPDGQITDCTMFDGVSPCALDSVPYGTLLGRIGPTGAPFVIGSSLTLTVPYSGTLYLIVNDNLPFYADNVGVFVVRIRN